MCITRSLVKIQVKSANNLIDDAGGGFQQPFTLYLLHRVSGGLWITLQADRRGTVDCQLETL